MARPRHRQRRSTRSGSAGPARPPGRPIGAAAPPPAGPAPGAPALSGGDPVVCDNLGEPIPVTGYAQVGVSGLSKVQYWLHREGDPEPPSDNYHAAAPWRDAEILPPPTDWGGGLPQGKIPSHTRGFNDATTPSSWPMGLSKVHWAVLVPSQVAGEYTFRCRTIDAQGYAQPMPRRFQKWGHSAIEQKHISVT